MPLGEGKLSMYKFECILAFLILGFCTGMFFLQC